MESPMITLIHTAFFIFVNLPFLKYASAALFRNETDKLALLEFKSHITEDPQEVLASWNESVHFCQWTGVSCSLKHQRVIALELKGQRLAGTISPKVANLSFLRVLDLAENSFHGVIASDIGHLFRLQTLNLSYNVLEGKIPASLSHCANLENLVLDHNYLRNHIPSELGSLSKLETLYLRNNNLTGNIPASIGNLTYLHELYLSYNDLEGEVPGSFSQLRSLILLGISVNSLSGEFPPALYNLSSLRLIGLSFNKFTGTIRANIGSYFPNLQRLYLADNYFTGFIPDSLSNCSELLQFDIPDNNFTGNIPMSFSKLQNLLWLNVRNNQLGSNADNDLDFLMALTNCSNLQFLDFAENQFGGTLPSSITNLSPTLTRLLIGGNNIRGSIPEGISVLFNLNVLSMKETLLTGNIPASIGELKNLRKLDLQSNQLTGKIPSSIGNLTLMVNLYLQNNSLEGSIPPSLGNLICLQSLDLSRNKINSTIPIKILGHSSLSVLLNLSHNSLIGPLPEEIGNLTNLAALDVAYNKLSGKIPSNIRRCLVLEILYMQGNLFEGTIGSLTELKNVQLLDLSSNNFSGQIPQSMVNMSSLLHLNLSLNNLEGEVPLQGVFKNAGGIDVYGNRKLCGGIKELHLETCPNHATKKPRKHIALKLILEITISLLCIVLLLSITSLCWRRKKLKNKPHSESETSFLQSFKLITYKELLQATEGFSSQHFLGSGNFGTVYKGVLSLDDTTVAVKVLKLQQQGAFKSFMAECQVLRSVRHRNLVNILTACSSIDFQGNDFKALIYQYLPKGSLEEWLHPLVEQMPHKRLSILQRINIATDVASALNYLHNECQNPVAHCDLKPSNVLLDNDLTAHVSDFGLARLLSNSSQDSDLIQFSSLGLKGTIGYAAPEYGMGGHVTTQGDVYSFGILLLELFTGRRPTDQMFNDNMNLHNFVKRALSNQAGIEILDQSALYNEVEEDDAKRVNHTNEWSNEKAQCLISILRIGIACSHEPPQDRMNMRHVVMDLHSIRDKFVEAEWEEKPTQDKKERNGNDCTARRMASAAS